ncbi:MAG: hypothetical protein JO266_19790 [Acidobacteria bacterium]|nr:hypothetical protein [Acidobacteriota bacterium]MBV9482461.1 hypothetical protein [Acidobacteriota bacterium]
MFNTSTKGPEGAGRSLQSRKYFKFQLSGWTDFDPMDKQFSEISAAIEKGGGLVSSVEVLEVQDDVSRIKDKEVAEAFQNILAANRVLVNVDKLPKKLVEDLRSVLNDRGTGEAKRPVSSTSPQAAPALKQAS